MNQVENDRGQWVPAMPLPYYRYRFLRPNPLRVCECGAEFKTGAAYRGHYALVHVMGLS